MVWAEADHLTLAVELLFISHDRLGEGVHGGGLEYAQPLQSGPLANCRWDPLPLSGCLLH